MPPPCADAKRRVLICGRSLATRVAKSVRRMRNYWIAFCYFNEVQKTERTGNVWGKGGRERGNPWIWDTFLLSFVLFLRTFKYKCRTYLYINSLINALPNQNWIVIDKIMINRSHEVKFIELSPVYAQMLNKNLYTIFMISVCEVADYTFSSSVSAAVAIIKVIYQLLISTLGNLSINHEWPR